MAVKNALVIGNSNYDSESLPGAAIDAEEWTELLKNNGFDVGAPLLNASKTEIVKRFGDLVEEPGNHILVYSGHGTRLKNANGGVSAGIVAIRSKDAAVKDYHDYVLSDQELLGIAGSGPEKNVVTCILDCCFAAGVATRQNAFALDRLSGDKSRDRFLRLPDTLDGPAPTAWVDKQEPMAIAASTDDVEAREKDDLDPDKKPHSIFSYFAIRALKANPRLSAQELRRRIAADVRAAGDGQEIAIPTNSGREGQPFLC